jgi:hypothetical protein
MALRTAAALAVAASLLSSLVDAQPPPLPPPPADVSAAKDWFDCAMRREAVKLAAELQPFRTLAELQLVADALAGSPEVSSACHNLSAAAPTNTSAVDDGDAAAATAAASAPRVYSCESWLYVSSVNGSDAAAGTLDHPLRTVAKGVDVMRDRPQHGGRRCLLLRSGTFFLGETLVLDASASGLTIAAVPGETVVISGGEPLVGSAWTPHKVNAANWTESNVWATNLPHDTAPVEAVRIDGARAIRALYPNHIPEQGFGSSLMANKWFELATPTSNVTEIWPSVPLQRDTANESEVCNEQQGGHGQFCQPFFQRYHLGVNGACDNFDPPAGYWCYTDDYGYKNQPKVPLGPGQGGRPIEVAGGMAGPYGYPTGLGYNQTLLPHSPYKNATGAIVHAWMSQGHWASWFFSVGYFNDTALNFSRGGFQSARGNQNGGEFYVENIQEELDYPTEFFHDLEKGQLLYFHNGSGAPPPLSLPPGSNATGSTPAFVVPRLKELIRVDGGRNKTKPVRGVSLIGLEFRDAAPTYLEPHGMPSGGDWALQRTAAIFVQGSEDLLVDSCRFIRLDGNALMLSSYNRNATIQRSEFAWTGTTAIALWGDTEGAEGAPEGMGWDGRAGNQPRGTLISMNLIHELGIWEKQSSALFLAKSCETTFERNLAFNGPRAGINFNDGFGGGNNISQNLIFNFCRESGDHGPVNSWNRQVYVAGLPGTAGSDGDTASLSDGSLPFKRYDAIERNLIIANYQSAQAVDTDDGSSYFDVHHNLFAYGTGGLKSDYGGHDNRHHHNVYAYLTHGKAVSIEPQLPNHTDAFYNNTVVYAARPDWTPGYAEYYCNTTSRWSDGDAYGLPEMHDNRVYQQGGNNPSETPCVSPCGGVRCMAMAFQQQNWTALADWQALGHDLHTEVRNTSELDVGWLLNSSIGLLHTAV